MKKDELKKLERAVEAVLAYEPDSAAVLTFGDKWKVTTPICDFAVRVNTVHDGRLGYGSYSPFSKPILWKPDCNYVANVHPMVHRSDLAKTRGVAAVDIGYSNVSLRKNIGRFDYYTRHLLENTKLQVDGIEWLLLDYDVADLIDGQLQRGMVWDIQYEIVVKQANILARFVDDEIFKAIDSGEIERIQRGHAILKPFLYFRPAFIPPLARLQEFLIEHEPTSKVHGLIHWMRVARFGDLLTRYQSARYGADIDAEVVQWFAFIHDCRRKNDEYDTYHGPAAAEYVDVLRSTYLRDLSDEQVAKLKQACRLHTTSHRTGDLTIDTCFDSDRLDLTRVGITPDPKRMATEAGTYIARCVDMKRI